MTTTEYCGYSIRQQKEFGPLRLLKWVEDGEFIVTKNNADAMYGAIFPTIDDARQAIDATERFFERFHSACSTHD